MSRIMIACCLSLDYLGGGMKINTPVLIGELQYYNDQRLTVVIRTVWELHKYQQRQGAS